MATCYSDMTGSSVLDVFAAEIISLRGPPAPVQHLDGNLQLLTCHL